jgi:hypothetical protein
LKFTGSMMDCGYEIGLGRITKSRDAESRTREVSPGNLQGSQRTYFAFLLPLSESQDTPLTAHMRSIGLSRSKPNRAAQKYSKRIPYVRRVSFHAC